MAYINSEKETPVDIANELESCDTCSMHLSAEDGKTVDEATQIVLHKIKDGRLLCEIFTQKDWERIVTYYPFSLSDAARKKLIEFLLNEKTV